jgi:hypothetical protein
MTRPEQDPKLTAQIDATLRRAFRETSDEDLPPRFKELLTRLRAQEDRSSSTRH